MFVKNSFCCGRVLPGEGIINFYYKLVQ